MGDFVPVDLIYDISILKRLDVEVAGNEAEMTNVFKAFLAQDGIQEPCGGGIVGHSVRSAEARQLEWYCFREGPDSSPLSHAWKGGREVDEARHHDQKIRTKRKGGS